jgi:hypothetical protein
VKLASFLLALSRSEGRLHLWEQAEDFFNSLLEEAAAAWLRSDGDRSVVGFRVAFWVDYRL